MSEISYYKEKGYSEANGIIVPREGKSKMTYIMDFIRYFDDLFIYRFFTGLLGKPLLGLHGDLLIIEGSVLKNIDLDKASVAEDYVFAVELIRKKCKTWQSKSHISFLSANSLPDLAKQRKRWSQGMKENFNDSPILMKLAIIFRTIIGGLWTVGAITVLLIPLLGVAHLVVPAAVYPLEYVLKMVFFTIPAGIYIWIVYIYGIAKAKKWLYLILIVIFGILEVAPDFSNKRDEEFVVIDKN
jgi:cellulose synthase/poly-beta-1,6-N-acetylglucosamine synthase-like glycosyltransferase